jgi:Flp pilus assembly protein TadD
MNRLRRIAWAGLIALAGCVPGQSSLRTQEDPGAARQGLSMKRTAEMYVMDAKELSASGHEAEAIGRLERARQLDPTRTTLSRQLAVLYQHQGELEKAGSEYLTALRVCPQDPDLLADVGKYHCARGDLVEAEKWLRGATALHPGDPRATLALGRVLGKQGKVEESFAAFRGVLSPPRAYHQVAVLLDEQGRHREAQALELKARGLGPGQAAPGEIQQVGHLELQPAK